MKKQIGLMTLSLMLASTAFAGGAGAPAPKTGGKCLTIAQLVATNPQLSTLNTALDAAGLITTLNAAGSYTVFAPTNAAFAKVPSDTLAGVLNDADALRGLLLYHVVAEKATSAQIRGVKGGTTVQGSDIMVSTSGNTVRINNATVTRADILACNGIVHLIDTVLMPPMAAAAPAPAPAAPAAAPAAATPAPAPAAPLVIPALPLSGGTVTQQTTSTTTGTATAPVTSTETASTETSTEATTTESSTEVTTEASTETAAGTTTEAAATSTETTAQASVTITPEKTSAANVYAVVDQDARFSTLRGLLASSGLQADLEKGGVEYTIFAPTNDAFATLPEDILAALGADKEALKKVLTYHVVNRKLGASDLGGTGIMTLQGAELDLGAAAFTTSLETSNGVVYPIDVVLLPPDFVFPEPK